jgi:hypothetical protein
VADKWWKQIERRVAAYFGVGRNPLSGSNSKQTGSDTLHPRLFIEIKARVAHAAVTLWRSTSRLAKKEGKVAVVVLAERNKHGFWIVCHSSDLQEVAALAKEAQCAHHANGNDK